MFESLQQFDVSGGLENGVFDFDFEDNWTLPVLLESKVHNARTSLPQAGVGGRTLKGRMERT